MALTLAEVERLVQAAPPAEPVPELETEVTPENLEKRLGQLAQLLRCSDAQAVTFMENFIQQPHEAQLQTELEALGRVIRRYDFEKALAELEHLTQKWQEPLPFN